MKILVIGASSFIGFRLYNLLKAKNSFDVLGTYNTNEKSKEMVKLDVADVERVGFLINEFYPDIIVWFVGNKNLNFCENHYKEAYKVNYLSVAETINFLNKQISKPLFIFISTDYVFGGEKGDYTILDKPNPKTVYGKTKYLAEKYIQKNYEKFIIIRTSAVMGKGGTFFDWLTGELKINKTINLYEDSYFTPTPVSFLVGKIVDLIKDRNENKVLHICSSKKFSRFEFGLFLKSLSNDFIATVIPVNIERENHFFKHDLSLKPCWGMGVTVEEMKVYLKEELT